MVVAITATSVAVYPPRVTLAVTGLQQAGINTFTGDMTDFEVGIGTWEGDRATVAQTTDQAHGGTHSLAMTATAETNVYADHGPAAEYITVTPGNSYVCAAWVRAAAATRTTSLNVWWYDAALTYLSTSTLASDADSAAAWEERSGTATVPALAAYARIRLRVHSPSIDEVHYWDDVSWVPDQSDIIAVGRTVAGVRTWVRGAGQQTATDISFLAWDAELPFGVAITWCAEVNYVEVAWSGPTTYTLPGGNAALSDAITAQSAEVQIADMGERTHDRASSVFRVGGRTVVVSGDRGQYKTQISLLTETDAERDTLAALLSSATDGILQLRQSGTFSGIDGYLAALSDTEARVSQDGTDQRRMWTLQVAEVEGWAPELPTLGFTFADFDTAYGGLTFTNFDTAFTGLTFLDFDVTDWST